jgi:hypothetical protein
MQAGRLRYNIQIGTMAGLKTGAPNSRMLFVSHAASSWQGGDRMILFAFFQFRRLVWDIRYYFMNF